jgi:DDE superfamily endonuclease
VLRTGFTPQGTKSENVLAARGQKNIHALRGNSRENVTLILAINALGEYFCIGIIFKGKRLAAHWCEGAPDDWFITCTESSMINTDVFYNWLVEFCKVLEQGVWSILFLDGHVSHISLRAVEYAEAHGLLIFQLPSHSSHLLQPLDLCGFGSVKRAFKEELTEFSNEHGYGASKEDMCTLINTAVTRGLTVANVKASFAAAGICPFDPQRAMNRIAGASRRAQKYTHAAALGERQLRQLERNGHTAAGVRATTIVMSKHLEPKKRSEVNRKRAGITTGGWLSAAKLRQIGAAEAAADAAKAAAPMKRRAPKRPRGGGSSSGAAAAKKSTPKAPKPSSDSDNGSRDNSSDSDSDRGNDGAFRAAGTGSVGATTPARTRGSAGRVPLKVVTNML